MDLGEIRTIKERLQRNMPAEMHFSMDGRTATREFIPHERLILLGGGHIAQALCHLAAWLDFEVTVIDDRPDFANRHLFPDATRIICGDFETEIPKLSVTAYDYVAVLTRGHRYDRECLRTLSRGDKPYYLGQVGSRRRVQGLISLLCTEDGVEEAFLSDVSNPIGLDIGAKTPKEIAVSILAELVERRNGKTGNMDVLEQKNSDEEIFQDLLQAKDKRALACIIATKGSVPAKSGALMSCGLLGRCAGTVGGGCGESFVLKEAREVLKSGMGKLVTVDMTADLAEEEGMVCGGLMQVWIEPVKKSEYEE